MSATLIWSVLVLVAVILLIEGYRGYRQTVPTMEDYFLGGRSLGAFFGFFTVMATLFSSFTYLGLPAAHYSQGVAYYALAGNQVLMGFIFYLVGTRLWILGKRNGFMNITDLFARRYESPLVALLVALVAVCAVIPYMGVQIRGGGVTLQGLSGGEVSFWAGVAYIVVVAMIYTMVGGFKSVVRTDTFQGILMYVGVWLAVFIIVDRVSGGFGALINDLRALSPEHLSLPGGTNSWTYPLAFSIILMFAMGNFSFPHLNQRVLAARDIRTIKWIGTVIAIGGLILSVPIVFIGLAGRVYYGTTLVNPDLVFPILIGELLPAPLAVLVTVGIIVAIMSTVDSMLLSITSVVVRDLWIRYFNPEIQDAVATAVSRVLVAVIMLVAIGVVVFGPPSIMGLMVNVAWPIMTQVFPVIVAGLFWQRANKYGAISCLLASEAVLIAMTLGWVTSPIPGITPAIWGLMVGTVCLVAGSLLSEPVSEKTRYDFFGFIKEIKQKA